MYQNKFYQKRGVYEIMRYDALINNIIENYKTILNDNLVGIYLHGSYVMGGFNPNISDIDFLVVLEEDIDDSVKKNLINVLLENDKYSPAKGLEMSIMKVSDTLSPSKPTPFVLHYSNYHKPKYIKEPDYICSGEDDPDLLAHLTIIKSRGICVHGTPIKNVFGFVPIQYYLDAIMYDIDDARNGIDDLHEYYVLNLCRSLYYLKEGAISSKAEGGEWAKNNLPYRFMNLIQEALNKYSGNDYIWNINNHHTNEFLNYMFNEIDKLLLSVMGDV